MKLVALLLCMIVIGGAVVLNRPAPVVVTTVDSDHFNPTADPNQDLLDYRPNQPSPVDLENTQPYHLLSDYMEQPRVKESLSCVNSRSCYATDFQRTIEKTGNYNQLTNNYKRKYPDSCSGTEQELTLNFYKLL
jgi:hypothetical protein